LVDVPEADAIEMANTPAWKPFVDQFMDFAFSDTEFFKVVGVEPPPPLEKKVDELS
jgi:hypothetical protein